MSTLTTQPSDQPLVSIGMPLFNAEQYLRLALNSLLAQDYPHFELIISDNGSTDSTADICREYAAQDGRIRFYGADENRGAAWNFKRVFDLAGGPYFMWAAHDDLWDVNYVSECVFALEMNEDVNLCSSEVRYIDSNGAILDDMVPTLDTRGLDIRGRVRSLLLQSAWCSIYGLFRTAALSKVQLGVSAWGADVVILFEILLRGSAMRTDKATFYYRLLPKTAHELLLGINPSISKESLRAPHWDLVRNLVRAVPAAGFSIIPRIQLQIEVLTDAFVFDSIIRSNLKQEFLSLFFLSYANGDKATSFKIAPGAFLLNPALFVNRGAWSIVFRSLAIRDGSDSK